jgi:membrane associated rhomboid family serine protease
MGDTLLPEIGLMLALYIFTRMLESLLGPKATPVFACQAVTGVIAGLGVLSMLRYMVFRYLL